MLGEILTVTSESLRTDVLILRVVGEIDLSSGHLLSTELKQAAETDADHVVIDATEVTFMDSTGLHALVEGKRVLHEKGIAIYLVPSSMVRRVLELVFPDHLFAARIDTVDAALELIDGQSDSPS